VDFVLAAIGALDYSIVGSIVGSIVDSIVGSIVDSIVGSVVSTLGTEVSLFLFLPFLVVDDRSTIAGTMIYIPLVSFPARVQEDGKVIEHFPFQNIVVCPPKSNWLIDRREGQKLEVWRASTW
jgi:tetrahydromethanopterin S-methyltransferase subunit C